MDAPPARPAARWERVLACNIRRFSGIGFLALMATMLLLSFLDRRHRRKLTQRPPLSVLIPCYNDGASVGSTIASIYSSYDADLLDVLVVDDCSTDGSSAILADLNRRYPFRLTRNATNRGKSPSLNSLAAMARHDLLLFVDADTELNPKAVQDMLARFECDSRVGAVSCPYRPSNHGILPKMQEIEYNMLSLTQGAHNVTSAMALWGGCLAVRAAAFRAVGGFSDHAITEDVDLAFKLNRSNWRVEQSFVPVLSIVPQSLKAWVRQKIRWTSGGMQCYVRHIPVWIRNPIQIFFIFSYGLLTVSSLPSMFADIRFTDHLVDVFRALRLADYTFWNSLGQLYSACGADVARRVGQNAAFCLLPMVYVLPLVQRTRDLLKLLLVIPFSFAYFPVYIAVSIVGIVVGVRRVHQMSPRALRGW